MRFTSIFFFGIVLLAVACGDDGGTTDTGTVGDATADTGGGGDATADTGGGGDGSTGDGSTGDGGGGGDGSTGDGGACMGTHPEVGPPRTCLPGNCLCVDMDTCFPTATARACCTAGELECATPTMDCNAEHPIVGPPRTCEPGMCFCANPDACFPPDVAGACCAVDVECVPAA